MRTAIKNIKKHSNMAQLHKLKTRAAFAIVEALISTLLFIIGFMGLLALNNYMLQAANTTKYRAEAVELTNDLTAQMLIDKNNLSAYVDGGGATGRTKWDDLIKLRLPNGSGNVSVSGADVTVKVVWKNDDEDDFHQYEVITYISYNS